MKIQRKHIDRYSLTFIVLSFFSLHLFAVESTKIHIPFKLVNGLTIIQAEVDGVSGSFLLDTGSNGIFIDGNVHHKSSNSVVTLGGSTVTTTQSLSSLKVGEFHQTNLEAQIISLKPIEEHLGIDIQGIIGGYLFQPKVVILDFKNSIITLDDKFERKEKEAFKNNVRINTANQIPIAKIKIENKWFHFALDSGSTIHFVDKKVLNQLKDVYETDETSTIKCLANTDIKTSKSVLKNFALGNTIFKNQSCVAKSFGEVNLEMDIQLDGILSLSQLSQEKVVLDYNRSRLLF